MMLRTNVSTLMVVLLSQESVELPLTHPEYYEEMGIKPPKGVILYGAPGTGQTNMHSYSLFSAIQHLLGIARLLNFFVYDIACRLVIGAGGIIVHVSSSAFHKKVKAGHTQW